MPTVRYQIKNEYGLADPALYGAADKDDPEALLEGVAMAGLVGILRQLGDLAEFAAEVFHDLHEEVMATSSRGHGLLLRVQQLEAEFPTIEKDLFNNPEQSEFNTSDGINWHPNLQIDQNMVTREDMPRFILDCYEESRGPPRLFMLDKFDSAEEGACLKRYSDPSFFKTQFASTENMEGGFHRERRSRNTKKKVPHQKNGITPGVQNPQLWNNKFEHSAIEKVPENQQINYRRLKRRHLNENMNFGRSYMQTILGLQSAEGTEFSTNSSGDSQENIKAINSIESSPPVREIIVDMPNGTVNVEEKTRPEYTIREAEDLSQLIQNMDSKEISEKEISKMENSLPTISINDIYRRGVSESSQSKSSSSLNDYRTDDVASELDNYLDALATMESEIETDSETRTKLPQNNLIKDYPNSGLCVEKTDTSKSKSYSEEISCDVDEKLQHDVAKLLVSESSSEVSPINIMDRGLDADECNETASSNKLIASQASENETSSCSADSATPAEANSRSAESDGFSNGMKSETNDECFNCEVMPPVSSEVPLFETDMVSGDLEQESEQDVKIPNDDQLLRAGNPIIKFPDSRNDQHSIKLPTDDGSHETIHDDPVVNESNGDCGTMHVITDVKSASYSHMGIGDSLLQPPNIENQEEQQRSISQASMEKSRELTPVDDRSSTGSTEGLFEVKRNCFSQIDESENAGFSNCSDIVGGSENDDVSAENSRDFIENDVMNSGVPTQESFVSNHEKLTPNDRDLESSYEQKPSNVVCALESSSSSSSSYQDIVLQVKTIKLEDNLPLSNENKCALSSSESESVLLEDQSQFDSLASKAQMEAKNHQLSEILLPRANDAMAHESIDQTDEKFLKDVSLTDLDSKVKLPQSSDKSSLNSTKDDVVNNPIDQMDEKLSTNVSPHNLSESNVEILGSCEMSSSDSTKPIDPMDKEPLAIFFPEDIEAKKRFLQLPETSNIYSTKTDAVHEPIGQMDNKISATIFSPEDSENRQVQSCEPSSFEPIKNDQNSVRHLETNKTDSHSSTCQLSREEPEARAFTLKEISTNRVVDKSCEKFFPEKYEKEENRLERAGSGISSPKASQVLSEAVERGIDIHDSTRTSSITLLQYSNQRGLEIPEYGLPSIHKETQVFDEDPPPPPLPPMKWRMGRFNLGSPAPIIGIQPTLTPLEDSSGPKLSAKLQSLPADSSIEREVGSSSSSHESPKIEVHQEGVIKETHDSNTKYAPQLPVIPSTTPESSSLLSPPTSSEADRMLKDKIIDGYFSDTSFATEAIPQGLLSYQGFYMYASDGEPFMREEYQNFVKKPSSLLNRPRDPLIEAVASHDKSTLRRVSELTRPSPKPEGERNNPFLEQIRSKSFNLRPAAVTKPIMKAPPTNLKVAAILEKANAIRQAVAGSDEDEDGDSWSDS